MNIGLDLDRIGVDAEVADTDMIVSAVVVLTLFELNDSTPRLVIAKSANLSWIEQAGMLTLANQLAVNPCEET